MAKFKYRFNNIGAGTAPLDTVLDSFIGPNGTVFRGGIQTGSDGFAFLSPPGSDLSGVDSAVGSGAMIGSSFRFGDGTAIARAEGGLASEPGGSFTFKKAVFAAAFTQSVNVVVIGITDDQQTVRAEFTVGTERTKMRFDWGGLDYVVVGAVGSVTGYGPPIPFETNPGTYKNFPLMIDSVATLMPDVAPLI